MQVLLILISFFTFDFFIDGKVKDAMTQKPIPHANVEVWSSDSVLIYSTITDSSGEYYWEPEDLEVVSGAKLVVTHPNYFSNTTMLGYHGAPSLIITNRLLNLNDLATSKVTVRYGEGNPTDSLFFYVSVLNSRPDVAFLGYVVEEEWAQFPLADQQYMLNQLNVCENLKIVKYKRGEIRELLGVEPTTMLYVIVNH